MVAQQHDEPPAAAGVDAATDAATAAAAAAAAAQAAAADAAAKAAAAAEALAVAEAAKHAAAAEPEAAPADAAAAAPADAVPADAVAAADDNPYASITPDQARQLLSATEDRDEIFVILLRAMRKRARFTSLFTIKGDHAVGRVALSKPGLDNEEIRQLRIPLNVPSRFKQVVASKAFSCLLYTSPSPRDRG